ATTQQWRRAERNAQHAEAARRLLVGVFENASPDENHGKAITAHQLLEKGEKLIAAQSGKSPATQADLTGLIGGLYWDIGDYPRAENLLKEAVASNASTDVPPEVKARNLVRMAKVKIEKNQYDEGIAFAREALTWARQAGEPAAAEGSQARREIADGLIGGGHATEAEPLLREAMAVDQARSDDGGEAVADNLMLLGYALLELSRLDEAIATDRLAIEAQIRIHGRTNSNVTYSMGTLATALRNQGKFVEAENVLREAVAIMETMYAPDHREMMTVRSNLLLTLENQGRYAEALDGRRAMLETQKKLSVERPDVMAYAYKNMAGDLLGLGRFVDAEATARDALAAWNGIQGSENEWHSVAARDALALALQFQGKYAEAESAMRKTIDIQQTHEAPRSIWLAGSRTNLGNLLRLSHRLPEAAALLRDALAALPETASPTRASLLAAMAETATDQSEFEMAQRFATDALTLARAVLPAHNVRLGTPLFALARVKAAQASPAEAEALLSEALAVRHPPYPDDDPRVLELQVDRVRALEELGKTDEARILRARIGALLQASSSPYTIDLRARLAPRSAR
ncbi:MAG: tetratricopeptide repeat protein, partial [Dokdonella sp.]